MVTDAPDTKMYIEVQRCNKLNGSVSTELHSFMLNLTAFWVVFRKRKGGENKWFIIVTEQHRFSGIKRVLLNKSNRTLCVQNCGHQFDHLFSSIDFSG